jgi:hypothetical protein
VKRKLQDYRRKQIHLTRYKDLALRGRVVEIAPPANYGFIETHDGRKIRFTSNNVVDYNFEKLDIGDLVRFVEAENGASAVHFVGKCH